MMVTAYATLASAGHDRLDSLSSVIAVIGIVVALMWWHVSRWTLRKTIFPLREKILPAIVLYEQIARGRKTSLPAHRLIALLLPWLLVLMWVAFLVIAWCGKQTR
jgi:hypothetical protein